MSRRRPGRLWLFFYGRRRRGFPGLLVGVLVAALLLGALYGLPHAADVSRLVLVGAVILLALLVVASVALVAIAALRPPRRGRR
ncbi:MAG TPA: hypothetical protein VKF59_19265 [Candidatus Dormibacteraeota bacterium]|nr:hypothetical protein [Candidatus Dormibacteraeota bacterium]